MTNKDNPKFYAISTEYIDYLREVDSKVPFNKDEQHSRQYIGVLEKINGHDYFVPLTSRNDKNFNDLSERILLPQACEGRWPNGRWEMNFGLA
ncbi:hypothetical protein IAW_05990 [Bacillus cereus str. Schrouff]|nr:hypothetical protein IAW_05990 [Bacillus cereus str. Schrouff]EOO80810.1 hypothetical protein IGY_06176 [Bacillus cereus K-5975c]